MTFSVPAISVILPVYNGGGYLEKTLDSILNQTFNNFELICVDDSSIDNSFDILSEYAKKDNRIKLFQKENGGNAIGSIILALENASGDYMFYCSQDDLMSEDLLEKTYKRALETSADAVIPDMIYYKESCESQNGISGVAGDKEIELSGARAFELSLSWKIHGFSLRKMSLVKKLGYSSFAMNSDEYTTREFYLNCKKIVFSEGTFFYRQDNQNALTKKITPNCFGCIETDIRLVELIIKEKQGKKSLLKMIKRSVGSLLNFYELLEVNKGQFSKEEIDKINIELKTAWQKIKMLIFAQKLYLLWLIYIIKGVVKRINSYEKRGLNG